MMKRVLALATGLLSAANGCYVLAASRHWYNSVPGVAATGPFNPHFADDVGVAFLVSGLAVAARAWRPRLWPAALTGAAFLAGHALIHLAGVLSGHGGPLLLESATVMAPAAVATWAATPGPWERSSVHA